CFYVIVGLKRGDRAVAGPHEAMSTTCVNRESGDRSCRVDARRLYGGSDTITDEPHSLWCGRYLGCSGRDSNDASGSGADRGDPGEWPRGTVPSPRVARVLSPPALRRPTSDGRQFPAQNRE